MVEMYGIHLALQSTELICVDNVASGFPSLIGKASLKGNQEGKLYCGGLGIAKGSAENKTWKAWWLDLEGAEPGSCVLPG